MKNTKSFIIATVLLFITWILLSGVATQELIFGGITAVIISLIFLSRLTILGDIKLSFKAFMYGISYFFLFSWELLKSNLDVAKRVISPKLPINPGIVKVKTKLKTPLGRAFLANSITLTPGTLTVEMRDEYFYIHWIDVSSTDINSATEAIVAKFEKYLEVIFG
jgi:multicomponent Na+:H+ antiporter subunit E